MATFTITISDVDVDADTDAAQYIVDQENARRAAADPPEDPLLDSNGAELKASYTTVLEQTLLAAHVSYQKQAAAAKLDVQNIRTLWQSATNAQRDAARTALGG
jgi:hypothetical protein